MYTYNAIVKRVVDGDTIEVIVDLGFTITTVQMLRLNRIDAYETRLGPNTTEEEKQIGIVGKLFLQQLLVQGTNILIRTEKDDKYGRYVADICLNDICINDLMVSKGYAVYKKY